MVTKKDNTCGKKFNGTPCKESFLTFFTILVCIPCLLLFFVSLLMPNSWILGIPFLFISILGPIVSFLFASIVQLTGSGKIKFIPTFISILMMLYSLFAGIVMVSPAIIIVSTILIFVLPRLDMYFTKYKFLRKAIIIDYFAVVVVPMLCDSLIHGPIYNVAMPVLMNLLFVAIVASLIYAISPKLCPPRFTKIEFEFNIKNIIIPVVTFLLIIAVAKMVVPKPTEYIPNSALRIHGEPLPPIISRTATDEYGNTYEIKPATLDYMMLSKTSPSGQNLWNKGLVKVDTGDIHIAINNDKLELIINRETPYIKILLDKDGRVLYIPEFWAIKYDEYEKFKDWKRPKCIGRFSFNGNSYYIFSVEPTSERMGVDPALVYIYKQQGVYLTRLAYLYSSKSNFIAAKEPRIRVENNDVLISFPQDGKQFKLNPEKLSLIQEAKNLLMLLPSWNFPEQIEMQKPKIINL